MEIYHYTHLIEKLSRKITCLIMEELTEFYETHDDFKNFERDYEFVRNMALIRMLKHTPGQSAKVLSPATSPSGTPLPGFNLN